MMKDEASGRYGDGEGRFSRENDDGTAVSLSSPLHLELELPRLKYAWRSIKAMRSFNLKF